MRNIVLFILLGFLCLNIGSVNANHHRGFAVQDKYQNNKQTRRSKQQAMHIAEGRSGGRAVAINLTGDGQYYRVRVLLGNGTITHVLVAAYQ